LLAQIAMAFYVPPRMANALFGAEAWLFALGALFVFVTLALPKGIIGAVLERYGDKSSGLKGATPPEARPESSGDTPVAKVAE